MQVKMYYNQLKKKIGPEGQNLVKLIGPQRVKLVYGTLGDNCNNIASYFFALN